MEIRTKHGPPSLFDRKSKIVKRIIPNIKYQFQVLNENRKIRNFSIDSVGYLIITESYIREDSVLSVWDTRSFHIICEFNFPKAHVVNYMLTPDSSTLFVSLMGGTIKKFSFFTGELLLTLKNLADGYSCYVMSISQNDENIMFGFENGLALFYKKGNDRPFKKFSFEIPINTCTFSSGSTFCSIGLDDGTIFVISMKSEHIWRQKIHLNPTTSVSFSAYSPLYMISSCIKSGEISFSKFQNNIYKVYKKISVPKKCRLVAYSFSYDETIAYGCSRNEIYAWESESGKLIGQLEVKELGIELISVSAHPCCRNICLVVSKSSISIWNYKTHEYRDIHIVQLGNTLIQSVQWADSLTLYGLFSDGSLKIFSTKSGSWSPQNVNEYKRFINNDGNEWPEILKLFYGKYYIHPFITNMTNIESILLSHLPLHIDDIDPIDSDDSSDESY